MWQDMVLYWAWRGKGFPEGPPPTKKRIEYADLVFDAPILNGPDAGLPIRMQLAITVFDDEVPTEVHRGELAWYQSRPGVKVLMPQEANDGR